MLKNLNENANIKNINKQYNEEQQYDSPKNADYDRNKRDIDRDTDRSLLKNLNENVNKNIIERNKKNGNKQYYDEERQFYSPNFIENQSNNKPQHKRESQNESIHNQYNNNNYNKINKNNFQRSYTKNLDNNHYRTIEDLYKHSPKAPVYYSKEKSNNKKANNYNQLNYLLSKRFNETDNINYKQKDVYVNSNLNKYQSDYGKNKHKYNITNAMDVLLDKENKN